MRKIVIDVPDGFVSCKLDVVLLGRFGASHFPKVEIHSEFPVVDDSHFVPGVVLPSELIDSRENS